MEGHFYSFVCVCVSCFGSWCSGLELVNLRVVWACIRHSLSCNFACGQGMHGAVNHVFAVDA